jgi:acyl carrier protein
MSVSSFTQKTTAANENVAMNVRSLVAEYLGVDIDRVSDEAQFFNDFGADWLDRLELMIGIEEHFDVEIDDRDVERLMAVGDLIRFIEAHKQSEGGARQRGGPSYSV